MTQRPATRPRMDRSPCCPQQSPRLQQQDRDPPQLVSVHHSQKRRRHLRTALSNSERKLLGLLVKAALPVQAQASCPLSVTVAPTSKWVSPQEPIITELGVSKARIGRWDSVLCLVGLGVWPMRGGAPSGGAEPRLHF